MKNRTDFEVFKTAFNTGLSFVAFLTPFVIFFLVVASISKHVLGLE